MVAYRSQSTPSISMTSTPVSCCFAPEELAEDFLAPAEVIEVIFSVSCLSAFVDFTISSSFEAEMGRGV